MLIGVPKEIKNHEYRVGLTPAGARELTRHGHRVLVQRARARRSACSTTTTRPRAQRSATAPTKSSRAPT